MGTEHSAMEFEPCFPGTSPFTDDSITLRAAGLLEAVVIVCPQGM